MTPTCIVVSYQRNFRSLSNNQTPVHPPLHEFRVSAVGLDPLATIIWVDFLSSVPQLQRLTSYQQTIVIKFVVILLGIAVMFIAYSVSLTAGIIEATLLAFAATTGALLGVFLMAMLIPMANWKVLEN